MGRIDDLDGVYLPRLQHRPEYDAGRDWRKRKKILTVMMPALRSPRAMEKRFRAGAAIARLLSDPGGALAGGVPPWRMTMRRRTFLKGVAAAAEVGGPLSSRPHDRPNADVHINTWGGSWTAAEAAFFKPFTDQTRGQRAYRRTGVLRQVEGSVQAATNRTSPHHKTGSPRRAQRAGGPIGWTVVKAVSNAVYANRLAYARWAPTRLRRTVPPGPKT
jgi:hypothetical protein